MDYKYMIVKYQPLSGGKGKVTLAMNVDLKLSFVPISILDFTCQNFGENFFDNLMKISRNFEGSPWEKSVQNSPGLFDFFKRIIEEYHQSKKKL